MAKGRPKRKKAELRKVLRGGVRDHHRFQLKLLLEHVREVEEKIFQLDCGIGRYLER